MRCPQCGRDVDNAMSFCPQCGTAMQTVTKEVSAPPVVEPPATQPVEPIETTPAKVGATDGLLYGEAGVDPAPTGFSGVVDGHAADGNGSLQGAADENAVVALPAPPKKGRKAALIAAICVVAVGLLSLAGYLLYPTVCMAVLGPARYYAMQEMRLLAENGQPANEMPAVAPLTADGDYELRMEFPDLGDPAANEALAELLGDLRIRVHSATDPAQGLSAAEWEVLLGEDSLLSCLIEQQENRQGISFPGLADGQIVSQTFDIQEFIANGSLGGMTGEQWQALLEEYLEDVLFTPLDGGTVHKGKATLAGISCTTHEFVLDQAVLGQMANALADKLENDERLVQWIKACCDLAMGQGSTFYVGELPLDSVSEEDIREMLRKAAAGLRDAAEEELSSPATFQVYYDGRGRLVARELTLTDETATGTIGYVQYEQDGREVYEVSVLVQPDGDGDPQKITLRWEAAHADDRMRGTVRLVWEEDGSSTDVLRVSYDLTESALAGTAVYTGSVQAALEFPGEDRSLRMFLEDTQAGDNTLHTTAQVEMQVYDQSFLFEIDGIQTYTPGADVSGIEVAEETTMDEDDLYALGQGIAQNLMSILYGSMGI